MKAKPPVFRTLDASLYKKIAGEVRGRLPGHVMIDVDRGKDENGRGIVLLRCKQPEVAKKVLADILGEEYIEPEIEEEDLPEKRREWWQRSIQMYFGGDNRGDADEIRKSVEGYRKRFQSDALRVRRRMFPEGKGGTGSSSFSGSDRSHVEERERGSSGGYAKAFREDADRYAKAFHDDVENISRRMFGGANAKEREKTTIERYSEVERAKGKEVKVIEKPNSRDLSEAEMGVLETIYELKNKRRMSKVLINDILRRGQTKHKGIREDNVGSVLKGLRAGEYLRWIMPGYELTTKGKEVLNVW
ncbi:MAG: hypothetical protein H8D26_09045 [Methanomicrobia archaeon]|nr:hypothetical protein [Methanomicrobia archaeon]